MGIEMGINKGTISIYGDGAFYHKQKPYVSRNEPRHVMGKKYEDSTNGDEHRLTKMPWALWL